MGPPPAPPPPPILKSPTVLPFSRRTTENAPRRNNNPVPAPSQPTRPRVDSEALQHAAASLRKTGYNKQIRGDFPDLSNGRLDRTNEQLPRQHWQNSEKQPELDCNQTRKPVFTPSASSNHPGSHNNIHGWSNSVNAGDSYSNNTSNKPYATPIYQYTKTTSPYSSVYSPETQHFELASNYQSSQNFNEPKQNSTSFINTYTYSSTPRTSNDQNLPSNYISTSREGTSPSLFSGYRYSSDIASDSKVHLHELSNKSYVDTSPSRESNMQTSANMKTKPLPSNKFALELRDKGLTASQREANTFKRSQRQTGTDLPFDVNNLLESSFRDDEVDQLVIQMANQLRNNEFSHQLSDNTTCSNANRTNTMQRSNVCVSCSNPITFEKPGCVALDQVFHVSCFNCKKCGRILAGSSFYNIDNNPTCENCYTESLDKCTKCGQPIADKLLRACGGTFHVECFICTVCETALDGVPFTVDSDNNVHCVPCFHDKFAPRCAVCQRGIIPVEGEKESVRVVAMDKSFHVECYRCEDCGLQLSSKIEGQGCYPLDSHLYCKTCNSNRLRVLANV